MAPVAAVLPAVHVDYPIKAPGRQIVYSFNQRPSIRTWIACTMRRLVCQDIPPNRTSWHSSKSPSHPVIQPKHSGDGSRANCEYRGVKNWRCEVMRIASILSSQNGSGFFYYYEHYCSFTFHDLEWNPGKRAWGPADGCDLMHVWWKWGFGWCPNVVFHF